MEPVSGQKLGRYTLTRRLGAGGMTEVWEATDELLKRRVAAEQPSVAEDPLVPGLWSPLPDPKGSRSRRRSSTAPAAR
jgi:serine/threonine protein kinase